jgi:hypothetical protein
MIEEIHVGDIGTQFILTITDAGTIVDLSVASTKQAVFQKPDRTTLTKDALFVTDGKDGQLVYTSIADDLNLAGIWHVQARVVLSSGEWHSNVEMFEVYGNL